jgi:hypothetical protein
MPKKYEIASYNPSCMSENLNLHTQTIQHNIFAVEWSGPPYDGHTTVTFQYSLIGDDKNGGRGKTTSKQH